MSARTDVLQNALTVFGRDHYLRLKDLGRRDYEQQETVNITPGQYWRLYVMHEYAGWLAEVKHMQQRYIEQDNIASGRVVFDMPGQRLLYDHETDTMEPYEYYGFGD